MKTPSSDLKDLIDCMNPSEKKEFVEKNTLQGIVPDYIVLFESFSGSNAKSETQLSAQLKFKHFKRVKHYLHKALLQYLATLETQTFEKEVMDLISVGNMLMDRSLFVQSKNVFLRAKKKAIEYELFAYRLIIEEKIFHVNGHLNNRTYVEGLLNPESEQTFYNIIDNIITDEKFKIGILRRWQYYEKHGAIFRSKKQTADFLALLKPYVDIKDENSLSTKSKHDYYSLKASFLREQNKMDAAITYLEHSFELAKKKKMEMVGMLPQVLVSLNNLLFIYAKYNMFARLRSTLDRIHDHLPQKASNRKVGMVSLLVFESYYCKYVPDYAERKKTLLWVEKEYPLMMDKDRTLRAIQTAFNLSVAYFCDSNFKKALSLINSLELREDFLNFPSVVSLVKVYKLILYFEMNKRELLSFAIRNTYRYLLKNKIYEEFEKAVIKGLSKLIATSNPRTQREALQQTYTDLIKVKENNYERSIFQTFNYSGWILCKLQKKDFKYVMTIDEDPKQRIIHMK